jgi:hypothetical protein
MLRALLLVCLDTPYQQWYHNVSWRRLQELLRREKLERLQRLPDNKFQEYPSGFAGTELGQLLQVAAVAVQHIMFVAGDHASIVLCTFSACVSVSAAARLPKCFTCCRSTR